MPNLIRLLKALIYRILNYIKRFYNWLRFLCLRHLKLATTQATEATITDLKHEDIMYKSEHFVVINKRYDVRVNSDDPSHTVTVATQLAHRHPEIVDAGVAHGFRFIHRLDFATSGAQCVALTKKGARWGSKAFAKRYVTKHYLALVRGELDPLVYTQYDIHAPIGEDSSREDVYIMCTPSSPHCKDPRDAHTTISVLEHGTYDGQPATKILMVPHTGRSHQLRVHMAQVLHHPIVGDYMYSGRSDTAPYRMMLHAYRLVIPMKYESIDVTCPDAFISDIDSLWTSKNTFQTYHGYIAKYGLRQSENK